MTNGVTDVKLVVSVISKSGFVDAYPDGVVILVDSVSEVNVSDDVILVDSTSVVNVSDDVILVDSTSVVNVSDDVIRVESTSDVNASNDVILVDSTSDVNISNDVILVDSTSDVKVTNDAILIAFTSEVNDLNGVTLIDSDFVVCVCISVGCWKFRLSELMLVVGNVEDTCPCVNSMVVELVRSIERKFEVNVVDETEWGVSLEVVVDSSVSLSKIDN